MNEDQIYLSTKSWFRKNGYLVLAGQPPSGSDSIPVVEIKDLIGGDFVHIEARLGEAKETLADNSKAKRLLKWVPEQDFAEWINKNKPK